MSRFQPFPSGSVRQITAADLDAVFDTVDAVKGIPTAKIGARGWLEALISGTEIVGQTVSIHTTGGAGIVAASRTSDSQNTGGDSTWGGGFFVVNDNRTQVMNAHGVYAEARRYAGGGPTLGIEVGVCNSGDVQPITPYTMIPPGLTVGYWASAGRTELAVNNNPSAFAGVIGGPGGCKFSQGIVFGNGSVAPGVSAFGLPVALALPQSYAVAWYSPVDAGVVGNIRSDVTAATSGAGGAFIFTNTGMVLQGPDGNAKIEIKAAGTSIPVVAGDCTVNGHLSVSMGFSLFGLSSFADNAAAAVASYPVSQVYVTADGTLKIRF